MPPVVCPSPGSVCGTGKAGAAGSDTAGTESGSADVIFVIPDSAEALGSEERLFAPVQPPNFA